MRHTDVVIAGGGLAGSLAAAMLGRAGIDAVLVDPHPVYPPDFRCEKLDSIQLQTLALTGLADAVLRASTPDQECWVARFGRLVDKRAGRRSAAFSTTRWSTPCARRFPGGTEFIHAKVTDIATGPERQTVKLSNGDEISARLVVVATGSQHRLAPEARHRPRSHQPRPFDLDRLRHRAGRPAGVPVLRADLFRRAAGGPDGLHHAVSDRHDDARQPVRLSRPARSLAEAIPRRAAGDALRAVAGPARS